MPHVFTHPATFYVRYLMLVQDDPRLASVNKTLAAVGLAELDRAQYAQIDADMQDQPRDFRPWDVSHGPSSRWLKSKKVFSLVHRDETSQGVFAVLADRRMREVVERMLVGGVGHVELAYRLRNMGWNATEEAVADFRHYFWNTKIMGLGDWADYFRRDGSGRTRDVQDGYAAALHAGPQLALYRSGVKVEVDRKKALEDVYSELVFTFHEVRTLATDMKKVEMLASLSRSISRIHERIDATDSALQDALDKYNKFRVLTDSSTPPSMSELAPTGTLSDTGTMKSRKEIR